MDGSDKQFGAFPRMVIRTPREALAEEDPKKTRAKIELLLADLQASLED